METSDLAAIAARLVFWATAGPGVSRIHDGESCRSIEMFRKDVGPRSTGFIT